MIPSQQQGGGAQQASSLSQVLQPGDYCLRRADGWFCAGLAPFGLIGGGGAQNRPGNGSRLYAYPVFFPEPGFITDIAILLQCGAANDAGKNAGWLGVADDRFLNGERFPGNTLVSGSVITPTPPSGQYDILGLQINLSISARSVRWMLFQHTVGGFFTYGLYAIGKSGYLAQLNHVGKLTGSNIGGNVATATLGTSGFAGGYGYVTSADTPVVVGANFPTSNFIQMNQNADAASGYDWTNASTPSIFFRFKANRN